MIRKILVALIAAVTLSLATPNVSEAANAKPAAKKKVQPAKKVVKPFVVKPVVVKPVFVNPRVVRPIYQVTPAPSFQWFFFYRTR